MAYILYHDNSSVTGRELKRVLAIDGGTNGPDRRPDRIIRWGNRTETRFQASITGGILNKKSALTDASNKGRCLELLTAAGINTPPAADHFHYDLLVGRTETHVGGSGFFLISSQRDFELARDHLHCTHFMTYVPTQREYRVHVFRGRVIGVGEKLMGENCTSLHIRNVSTGWTFSYGRERTPQDVQNIGIQTVQALGLDFGACDIIKSINNNFYVLEVNTAPSLCKPVEGGARREVDHGPVFDQYVEAFRNWIAGR